MGMVSHQPTPKQLQRIHRWKQLRLNKHMYKHTYTHITHTCVYKSINICVYIFIFRYIDMYARLCMHVLMNMGKHMQIEPNKQQVVVCMLNV